MHSYPDANLIEKLEQLVHWHTQSASQWEDIKKTQEEFHKRQQAQLENFDRRIKAMEAVVRKLVKDTKDDKRATKSLTKEQKKFKHQLCEEFKGSALPTIEIRKSISKRLFDQYKDDPQLALSLELCETQVTNWFYDQMRNKSRPPPAQESKKKTGRKRKADQHSWAVAEAQSPDESEHLIAQAEEEAKGDDGDVIGLPKDASAPPAASVPASVATDENDAEHMGDTHGLFE